MRLGGPETVPVLVDGGWQRSPRAIGQLVDCGRVLILRWMDGWMVGKKKKMMSRVFGESGAVTAAIKCAIFM